MTDPAAHPDHAAIGDDRPMGQAMLRGLQRRCPCCGSGPMMRGYLTVREACPVCGEALHHQRADDGPAYLTILIVGKLLAPMLYWTYVLLEPEPLVMASGLTVLSVALSVWLLPRLKGMMVAIQWSRRMHGFGAARP